MTASRIALAFALIAFALPSLSACGRKGDLLTPSQAAAEERKAAQEAGTPVEEEAPAEAPRRRFILDALID
ncbi:MAG: hypothetical protein IPL47_05675 [Phyllobacteriaceae bacterium]|nr:hypothetical protein [Phyllobacteriaceae bacterium]